VGDSSKSPCGYRRSPFKKGEKDGKSKAIEIKNN
jgi:hypothetical protein